MVKYYGRARTRTGSVNTNQLGLKMSGCPSTVGKQGRIARYMGRRVDCMMGLCKPIRYHEVIWPRTRMRNQPPFCKAHATKCQAAAGGVGTDHNIPYYRIPAAGESGCTPAPVVGTRVFQLTTAPIVGEIGTVGFARDGLGPPAGDLQPREYNGRKISYLVTVDYTNYAPDGTWLTIVFSGTTVPDFNKLTIVGMGVNSTFQRVNADISDKAAAVRWCYPSGAAVSADGPLGCDATLGFSLPGTYTLTIS